MAKAKIGDIANLPVFTGENGTLGVKDAAAALEALGMEYEVGTWNATLTTETGEGLPIYTPTSLPGRYVKIGNYVFFSFKVWGLEITEISAGTAQRAIIGGLPYTPVLYASFPVYTSHAANSVIVNSPHEAPTMQAKGISVSNPTGGWKVGYLDPNSYIFVFNGGYECA